MHGVSHPDGADERRWGVRLEYDCQLERLGPELASVFVRSRLDTEGEAFLAGALKRRHSRWRLWARQLMNLFLSDFDANALLGMYRVFLLSTPQALSLLERGRTTPLSQARLLDVGAGSGDVTTRLAPLVSETDCTEASFFMARRLRQRGFPCWQARVGEGLPADPLAGSRCYDIISLLNVIDRTNRPRTLLRAAVAHLPPGGSLLLSTPLPFDPFYYAGAISRAPEERLNVHASDWEEALVELWKNELQPLGLSVHAVTRVPYLSEGDAQHAAYVLDNVVLSCSKTPLGSSPLP
jgi:2-polyprenyl-3-methyl-5-hydroxy-6-metoxy-1,4-benzoquinol methylase